MRTHLLPHALPAAAAGSAVLTGKFLQLIWRGDEYLVFAEPAAHRFHNQILARFLAERGVEHRWRDEQTLEFDGAQLTVVGGGRFRLDTASRTLELWDHSQAYGRFAEPGLAERIAAADPAWTGYRVTIL